MIICGLRAMHLYDPLFDCYPTFFIVFLESLPKTLSFIRNIYYAKKRRVSYLDQEAISYLVINDSPPLVIFCINGQSFFRKLWAIHNFVIFFNFFSIVY